MHEVNSAQTEPPYADERRLGFEVPIKMSLAPGVAELTWLYQQYAEQIRVFEAVVRGEAADAHRLVRPRRRLRRRAEGMGDNQMGSG